MVVVCVANRRRGVSAVCAWVVFGIAETTVEERPVIQPQFSILCMKVTHRYMYQIRQASWTMIYEGCNCQCLVYPSSHPRHRHVARNVPVSSACPLRTSASRSACRGAVGRFCGLPGHQSNTCRGLPLLIQTKPPNILLHSSSYPRGAPSSQVNRSPTHGLIEKTTCIDARNKQDGMQCST